MHGRYTLLAVLLVCVAAFSVACTVPRGVRAVASCGGVSPDAIWATLAGEDGATVEDVGRGTLALEARSTRGGITAQAHITGEPPELRLVVGGARRLPEGVSDEDIRRRAEELMVFLSTRHPQLGAWDVHDRTEPDWIAGVLALLFLASLIVVPVGAVALAMRLNAKTRASLAVGGLSGK